MSKAHLTVLNFYTLKGTAAEFRAAIEVLADRVRREGHSGVRSYQFYVNTDEKSARAVIEYENAAAWIGHHDIAMAWPEMKGLHAVAALSEVTFLGEMTPEIKSWIDRSTLTAKLNVGNEFAAGFRR
ncbi:MAG: hypothetical protein WCO04_09755, partial [Pseudomonadota bacterium]